MIKFSISKVTNMNKIVILWINIYVVFCYGRSSSNIEDRILDQLTLFSKTQLDKLDIISCNPNDVHFYYYPDKRNPAKRVEIVYGNKESLKKANLTPNKTIHIYTHGFLLNITIGGCDQIKNGYLKRDYGDIICVDWSKLSGPNPDIVPITNPFSMAFYFIGQKTTVIAGIRMAKFLYFLKANKVIQNFENIHLIGHSLGAHMMGNAGGKVFRDTGVKVGRITGLDVAGPFYKKIPAQYKLDKSKGQFVNVIHTDSELFGTPESVGHVDFFANGGRGIDQPACKNKTNSFESEKQKDQATILSSFASIIGCGHARVYGYLERAILGEKFFGCMCKHNAKAFALFEPSCPKPKKCSVRVQYGPNMSTKIRGNYYVEISQQPPQNMRPEYLKYELDGVQE